MKTFIYAAPGSDRLNVGIFNEQDPALADLEHFRELGNAESKVAARYTLTDGKIIDAYPGKTDEEVFALIEAAEQAARPDTDLDMLKRAKINEIRSYFNAVVEHLKGQAAPYEVATWETQRIEYTAWLTDKTASTPYVNALAEGRQIDRDLLMEKIGVKVANLARIQGIQQALEHQVEVATDAEQVSAITMPNLLG